MRVRVADYIAQTLAKRGIRQVFLLTGGGAMHLNDAFGRCEGLQYLACHHEQTCATAAESYTRMSGRLAAVNVTTGPGGTNALTGVYGAYVDSIGMVVISGQVKWETLVASTGLPLRQLGDQEVDIVRMAEPVTKYAVSVTDPSSIRYHLEKALYLASAGRPGPVWLDVPMNVQGASVETSELRGYDDSEDRPVYGNADAEAVAGQVLDRLRQAKRPVILPGTGVRISGAYEDFLKLIDRLGVPVATAFNAHDLLWNDHPLYVGRPGTVGDRPGNFAVQNADFLLVLGCRLNIRQVSYEWRYFAREAFKAIVDIDALELQKPTVKADLPIHADLADLLPALLGQPWSGPTDAHRTYLSWCKERLARYPTVLPEYWDGKEAVNPYCFVQALFEALGEDDRVVTGDGTAVVSTFQAAKIKKGQRLYTNSGSAPMGYDLPAAIGASIATERGRVVCVTGEGSIQLNLQDLQTIATHQLPIKLFVLDNGGYHSIRQTQSAYFPDNPVGCGEESGLGFPDFEKVAAVYGFPFVRITGHADLRAKIRATLEGDGPRMALVVIDKNQPFAPKLTSRRLPDGRMVSSPLEDQAPFLDREELEQNMLIPLVGDDGRTG